MTPAIDLLVKHKIAHQVHEYQHDPSCQAYGLEAAEKIGVAPELVFKTLVVKLDGKTLAVAIIPVAEKLSMKAIAKAAKAKKAVMAEAAEVQRSSGYVLGGVSPLGQKRLLTTVIDGSAVNLLQMYVSGGRRGLDIALAPEDLKQLLKASFAPLTA
ncbi:MULTISPECIES: Cys-tRNA(Pro) deacylase [Shewanella]|uniref:Cys-tRNA(Pro)/Cys-tRNA(Cys) deacylase n=1 Tax=Shewanella fidelis TaxID=173509 RepID=A0AAW8NRQ3_9GAMM|nr:MULTISPECIES: Cys-tRNA(Pro) deacylase [Shewanella]MDR8525848.1 Cys-tRNA(Pro) deacylase [Shewanella fidelis]MDW4813939.1 Cys-tRNA(Pro) deacylase [Shewanella fidelis]MDW4818060.1 Cys-tRNA(Pro) deacylase [Shewanella fidelis]MDW4822102.1 Cys-tRNA(Pro) deacylase [Shewanella fidelis]MDW4826293.1 Cys-tRNA(Pro) deacylase [Shewanella fidelis]